jgi:hypothetical protein
VKKAEEKVEELRERIEKIEKEDELGQKLKGGDKVDANWAKKMLKRKMDSIGALDKEEDSEKVEKVKEAIEELRRSGDKEKELRRA